MQLARLSRVEASTFVEWFGVRGSTWSNRPTNGTLQVTAASPIQPSDKEERAERAVGPHGESDIVSGGQGRVSKSERQRQLLSDQCCKGHCANLLAPNWVIFLGLPSGV